MKLVPGIHTEELELFAGDNKYGFDVTIKYKDSDERFKGELVTHNNSTEVHWMYNVGDNAEFSKWFPLGVAIESDIHGDGGTRELHRIEYIDIQLATVLHPNH